jgi:hypothetical protein
MPLPDRPLEQLRKQARELLRDAAVGTPAPSPGSSPARPAPLTRLRSSPTHSSPSHASTGSRAAEAGRPRLVPCRRLRASPADSPGRTRPEGSAVASRD